MKTVSLILGLMGFIFLIIGIIIVKSGDCSAEGFTRTRAKLVSLLPDGGLNQYKPVVEFEVDGKIVKNACQLVNLKRMKARAGDTVDIYYRAKKTLGITSWSIVIDTDDNALNRQIMLPRLASVVFIIVSVILLAVAVVLLFKK